MRTVEDVLAHHGVKGQKWGVRNDKGHEGERAKTKKIARLDKKFVRNANTPAQIIAVHNRAAQLTNKNDVERINNKPEYKNADFRRDSPLRRKYYAEHKSAMIDNLEKAAAELGTNASGTKRYDIVEWEDSWDIVVQDVKHSTDSNVVEASIQLHMDGMGHITSITIVSPIAHSDNVSEFLQHHGVKGQKWGVRNKKSRVKPSSDARKVADLKKKKPSQLTNKQLKTVQERHNLEQNFSRATPKTVEKGHAFAKTLLAIGSTAAGLYALSQSPGAKRLITAGKAFVDVSLKVTPANKRKIDVSRFQRSAQGTLF